MDRYEILLDVAECRNLTVKEVPLIMYDGLARGSTIGIRSTITTHAQKADVLAEEIAHSRLTVGDILDQSVTENRKQEHRARALAYDMRIGLDGIVGAYNAGCVTAFEMADYLGTTEKFLCDALEHYRQVYGESVKYNGYLVSFEPYLAVRTA